MVTCSVSHTIEFPGEEGVGTIGMAVAVDTGVGGTDVVPVQEQAVKTIKQSERMAEMFFIGNLGILSNFNTQEGNERLM